MVLNFNSGTVHHRISLFNNSILISPQSDAGVEGGSEIIVEIAKITQGQVRVHAILDHTLLS